LLERGFRRLAHGAAVARYRAPRIRRWSRQHLSLDTRKGQVIGGVAVSIIIGYLIAAFA
jgi:hypothetical protein